MNDSLTIDEGDSKLLPHLEESDYPENARRMLRAALRLFARKGYAGTSVREIVQAADVTNPMLYYYFDNKEGLFRTLIAYLFDIVTREITAAIEQNDVLERAVEQVIIRHFEACLRSPVALQFVYAVLFGPDESTPTFDVFDAREEMTQRLTQRFDDAIDAGEIDPATGFDADFMTEQLLGVINNHLMRVLKLAEKHQGKEARLASMRENLATERALELKRFYFSGIGTLAGGDKS